MQILKLIFYIVKDSENKILVMTFFHPVNDHSVFDLRVF